MVMERWTPRRAMRRWYPRDIWDEMDRMWREAWGESSSPVGWWRRPLIEEKGWLPAVDMLEKEDKLIIKAELPGVSKDDVSISVSDNVLTIKGEKKTEEEVKEEDYYCCERAVGSFYRAITLPANVDADKISATFKDGVMEITVPKVEEAKPKEIEVKVK